MVLIIRDEKDYAIEHAEYLAKAAENYLTAVGDEVWTEMTESAQDNLRDKTRALRGAIYEFRKRAERTITS